MPQDKENIVVSAKHFAEGLRKKSNYTIQIVLEKHKINQNQCYIVYDTGLLDYSDSFHLEIVHSVLLNYGLQPVGWNNAERLESASQGGQSGLCSRQLYCSFSRSSGGEYPDKILGAVVLVIGTENNFPAITYSVRQLGGKSTDYWTRGGGGGGSCSGNSYTSHSTYGGRDVVGNDNPTLENKKRGEEDDEVAQKKVSALYPFLDD